MGIAHKRATVLIGVATMSGVGLEEVCQALAQKFPHVEVLFFPELDSTNNALLQCARAGKDTPILIVTKHQTKGRGRMGKTWYSLGEALTFSFGLPYRPQKWDGLSLAVGLSLVQSLDAQKSLGLQVKWPNDIWRQGQKLGGILIETLYLQAVSGRDPYAVIGIGLNIAPPQVGDVAYPHPFGVENAAKAELDSKLSGVPPIYLQDLLEKNHSETGAAQVLEQVFPALQSDVLAFAKHGFPLLMPAFSERDALYGKLVHCSDGRSGQASGVSAQGALLLRSTEAPSIGQTLEVVAGEVSVSVD